MTSVRFCTPEMLEKYRKIQLLANYVDETEKVVEEYNKEHDIDNSVLVNGGGRPIWEFFVPTDQLFAEPAHC